MDKEAENCIRALKLMKEAGQQFCVALIKQKHASLDEYLSDSLVYSKGRNLKELGSISEEHYQLLFPPTDLHKWDLTLALCFLKRCSKLDESEEDIIDAIRSKGREIAEKNPESVLTEDEFTDTCESLVQLFERSEKLLVNYPEKMKIKEVCIAIENEDITEEHKDKIDHWNFNEKLDAERHEDNSDLNQSFSIVHDAAYIGKMSTLHYIAERFPDKLHEYDSDGNLAIHRAAEGGQLQCLIYLIDSGIDPYSKTGNQIDNIMYKAIKGKSCEIVNFICEKYPRMVNDACSKTMTPIFISAILPSEDIVRCLLKHGTDIGKRDDFNHTVFHQAAREGSLSFLKMFNKTNLGELKLAKDKKGCSVCHAAANSGHLECLKQLVEMGFDPTLVCRSGNTILHIAALRGYLNIVEYVCRNFTNLKMIKNKNGETALHSAAVGGYLESLKLLIEQGNDLSVSCQSGNTILHTAALRGYLNIVEYVCKNFQNLKMFKNKFCETALHSAARGGHLECLKLLIEIGFDQTLTCRSGNTILHTAVLRGYLNIVEYVCKNFPNLKMIKNKFCETALHSAAVGGHLECLKLLIEIGFDPTLTCRSGLHTAALRGYLNIVNYVCRHVPNLKKINDKHGKTALHSAAFGGHLECLKLLIEQEIDPTMASHDGFTVLHAAASKGFLNIVDYLCKTFPDLIELKTEKGRTALHMAVVSENIECLQYLVDHGLSVHTKMSNGSDCLAIAKKKCQFDMARYLQEHFEF